MNAYFLRPHIYIARLSRVLQNLVNVPCDTFGQASRMQGDLPRSEYPLGWQHPEPHIVLMSLSHKITKSNPGMAFSTTLYLGMELSVQLLENQYLLNVCYVLCKARAHIRSFVFVFVCLFVCFLNVVVLVPLFFKITYVQNRY